MSSCPLCGGELPPDGGLLGGQRALCDECGRVVSARYQYRRALAAAPNRPANAEPKVYAYVRVSSDPQAKSGVGLAGQDHRAREYYQRELKPLNAKWVGIFEDKAVSAFKHPFHSRAAASEILRLIQPGDHILIPMLDRGFRSTKDFLSCLDDWMRQGIFVHIPDVGLNTTREEGLSLAKLFSTMRAAFAEFESRIKRQRQLDCALILKQQGRPAGRAPLGWKTVRGWGGRKKLAPHPEQRAVMMEIVKLHLKGWGWRRISTFLAKQGVMYQVRRSREKSRLGYTMEFWSDGACERGFNNMLKILAEEEMARRAALEAEQSPPTIPAAPPTA